MTAGDLFQAMEPVIEAFDGLGIRYRIGGSVASSAYGIARATLDIDLVADLEENHIGPLVDRLREGYYIDEERVRDAVARRSSFNLVHLGSMIKVDVFVLKPSPYDQAAFARARLERLAEGSAREHYLTSPEDVILNKLDWYRQGGGVSERQWNDVLGVLKVQGTSLELHYLHFWAATLGLTELLSRALAEAGIAST